LSDYSIYSPPSTDIQLIYADDSLLVVNKPYGLLAVPGRGVEKQDCLISRLQVAFPDALTAHRLDMSTSGLMIFARGEPMQRQLSRLFSDRSIEKGYVALVAGHLAHEAGEINLPIAADWFNRPLRKIDAATGKRSLTRFKLLTFMEGNSRVELQPITGRTHQLRLHLSAIGYPILGDALYGSASNAPRLMLHASSLKFAHPVSGQLLNFVCNPEF
jgi:tRNA pseudouridine32 synthase/23S rRNA pseudouridine746 synthase